MSIFSQGLTTLCVIPPHGKRSEYLDLAGAIALKVIKLGMEGGRERRCGPSIDESEPALVYEDNGMLSRRFRDVDFLIPW